MKILSIGNSFSVDSQRYVREIAAADQIDLELGNLYIGGCSLERHCENMVSGLPAYEYFINNSSVGACALQTALNDNAWDVITLQQASHFSGIPDTYYPYINQLADYVRKNQPQARIYVNETWAYEFNSTHSAFVNYNSSRFEMHQRLSEAYKNAALAISAEILPVGDVVSLVRENPMFDPEKGGVALTRDGFHLSLILGRYLASAVWYECLTGNDIRNNHFIPMNYEYCGKNTFKPIESSIPSDAQMRIIKDAVHSLCAHR